MRLFPTQRASSITAADLRTAEVLSPCECTAWQRRHCVCFVCGGLDPSDARFAMSADAASSEQRSAHFGFAAVPFHALPVASKACQHTGIASTALPRKNAAFPPRFDSELRPYVQHMLARLPQIVDHVLSFGASGFPVAGRGAGS